MMKNFKISVAKFIVERNSLVATGGAIYACFKIGSAILRNAIDPLSLIFVLLLMKFFYPLIHLVAGIIARALKIVASAYLRNCGEFVDDDTESDFSGQGYNSRESENTYHKERSNTYGEKTEYGKNEGSNTDNGRTGGNAGQAASDYDAALKFFELQVPFTQEQLKAKRRSCMKTAHPDAGGNAEDAKKINRYYDVLKRYAA